MAQAFEQQPRESSKAFAAFSLYLGMGAQRSLAAVAQKLAKSTPLVKRWSARFDWAGRVAAYSAHLATVERETIEALEREKGVEWHKLHEAQKIAEWKLRTEYYELALEGIRRWKAKPDRVGSLEGLARLGEVFLRLGRLASGMGTERTEVTGEDGGPIRLEFEAALRKVYGQAAPAPTIAEAAPAIDVEVMASPQNGEGGGLPGQRAISDAPSERKVQP